jgi:hypothetical protein
MGRLCADQRDLLVVELGGPFFATELDGNGRRGGVRFRTKH